MNKTHTKHTQALFYITGIIILVLFGIFLFTNQKEEVQPERIYITEDRPFDTVDEIPVIHEYLPNGHSRRPGEIRAIKYITIHETDNRSASANAKAHSAFLLGSQSDVTSWHYTVDDATIYHHLPDNEIAFNAGDGRSKNGGNINGIGIEMCVNVSGNYEETLRNTAKLSAKLLHTYDLTLEDVHFHSHFMNKICPHRLITEGRVYAFLTMIQEAYEEMKENTEEQE